MAVPLDPQRVCALLTLLVLLGCGGGEEARRLVPDGEVRSEAGVPDLAGEGDAAPDLARPAADLHPADRDGEPDLTPALDSGSTDDGGAPVTRCRVRGQLLDLAGAPLAGLRVVLCNAATCFSAETDAAGQYAFASVRAGLRLYLKPLAEARGLGAALVTGVTCPPVGDEVVLEPVRLPPLGPATVVAAAAGAEVTPLPGLTLRLPAGLSFPSFGDEAELRGAELPLAAAPGWLTARLTPERIFVFSPFGTVAPSPIGCTVDTGLAGGSVLESFVVDHLTGELVAGPTLVVEEGGLASSPAGEGLGELTWFVLARPPAGAGDGGGR
ncbi:MAG: carboxypeptidase-like regulatory domain-containing protein [Myxococcota bacterium]|jgi:hypothetical protein|nr:carboxypeptidase-like regulatory domain-containing protein [Myxococcota bacterium]